MQRQRHVLRINMPGHPERLKANDRDLRGVITIYWTTGGTEPRIKGRRGLLLGKPAGHLGSVHTCHTPGRPRVTKRPLTDTRPRWPGPSFAQVSRQAGRPNFQAGHAGWIPVARSHGSGTGHGPDSPRRQGRAFGMPAPGLSPCSERGGRRGLPAKGCTRMTKVPCLKLRLGAA